MARTRKPVSGPSALSQRTDLTPQGAQASRGQPIRVAPGGAYGDRQASIQQQQAAPMAAGGGSPAGGQAAQAAAPAPPLNVFGPSDRPFEPITAGVPVGPGPGGEEPLDTDRLLQIMFNISGGSPAIARLMIRG